MKPIHKKIISITILILIAALFAYYISSHFHEFKQLSLANPWLVIPLIIISLLVSLSLGIILKYLVEPFGIKLKFKEWFGLSVITSFYNTITPFRGGMAARAIYLKKKHNLPYTNFLATLSGIYVINFFAESLIGLISLGLIYLEYGLFNIVIFLIFIGFFIPTLFIILFSPKLPETRYEFANKVIRIANGWHMIRGNKKIVFVVSIVTLTQIFLSAIGLILSYEVFDINIGMTKALFLVSISLLGIVISITPGSLGIAEAISVFSALIIGITPAQSLSVAILGRIIGMITIFTLGPIYSYILLKHRPKKAGKTQNI